MGIFVAFGLSKVGCSMDPQDSIDSQQNSFNYISIRALQKEVDQSNFSNCRKACTNANLEQKISRKKLISFESAIEINNKQIEVIHSFISNGIINWMH